MLHGSAGDTAAAAGALRGGAGHNCRLNGMLQTTPVAELPGDHRALVGDSFSVTAQVELVGR